MRPRLKDTKVLFVAVVLSVVLLAIGMGRYLLATDCCSLMTFFLSPDQQGQRLFQQERYGEAAERFVDPQWQATALYRAGEFKKAAGIYAGMTSAKGVFNYGNALVMQGKYEEAVKQYDRAVSLVPKWEAALVNRHIAAARAERLRKEGGDMTGGMLEADEIMFDKGKKKGGEKETVAGAQKMSNAEMRAVWLRQVQTKPADFLRAKFAYQYAMEDKGK